MIRFECIDTKFSITNRESVRKWIKTLLDINGCAVGDINYIFSNDEYVLEVNKSYLGHDYYTDIITFDTSSYSEPSPVTPGSRRISSDIFISVDTVVANAAEYGCTALEEFYRVMAHGILHLVGFDDHSDEDSLKMRAAENSALDLMRNMFKELLLQKSLNKI